ncbi:MAG: hypothetical protein GY750_04480 [Lentisphaerae bacterium]|nr:hypothetical protein [Lentisphaerota bacterium]
MKFDFMALFKLLDKISYPLDSIEVIPTNSLKSQEAVIETVEFLESNKIRIHVNDINAAAFMDFLKTDFKYNYKLHVFFNILISNLLLTYNSTLYFEGKSHLKDSFQEGESLIAREDINVKSYSFIHSFLARLYSEYTVYIYRKNEFVATRLNHCKVGSMDLNGACILGDYKNIKKKFFVIRFITELPLNEIEKKEIMQRKEMFKKEFSKNLDEINIIFENLITDEDLYTTLPEKITDDTILIQSLVRIHKEVNFYTE